MTSRERKKSGLKRMGPELKKWLVKQKNECKGDCIGNGYRTYLDFSPETTAPEQSRNILNDVILSAKARAKADADRSCEKRCGDCKCNGEFLEWFEPQRIPIPVPPNNPNNPTAIYVAAYLYTGRCRLFI